MSGNLPDSPVESSTLVELLRWRALHQPDQLAYTFLIDGEAAADRVTYGELDRQARAMGALLQKGKAQGERALLLYPPGLEFIVAFFGCLYAGVTAVPAYPPHPARLDRTLPKLRAIANDAQPSIALTTASILPVVERSLIQDPDFRAMRWLATDKATNGSAEEWQDPPVSGNTLAFLQYTSGSTAAPKGVMVSHANLLHNQRVIQIAFEHTEQSTIVGWLPLYHDMGLIGNVLQPLYVGGQCILMPPVAFLQKPLRWLQAIARYKAGTSGGPNFAYDLCVRKITPEQRTTLDLRSWSLAFNGAEPIHYETLERFASAFKPCGFRQEAFYPCYGLAEATLFVTGGLKTAPSMVYTVREQPLEQDYVVAAPAKEKGTRTLVSCGQTWLDQKVAIVDAASCTQCPPDRLGEIWISGPSVAQGYWHRPEETEQTFYAYLADTGEGPFFRTGDMGFLKDGELFVTGRLKDLIIIAGRNHYPQDIELTVEQRHAVIRPSCCAAFSVDVADEERLVIVGEVERHSRRLDVDEVVGAIRQTVAEHHDVQVYAVVLVKTGSMPKTSSGKLQRHACRERFLAKSLDMVGEWIQQLEDSEFSIALNGNHADERTGSPNQVQPAQAIQAWLVSQIATRLKVNPHNVDVREPFARYGLDSVQAVNLAGELEEWLGRRLSPTLAYEYPTIEILAQYLAGDRETSKLTRVDREQGIATEPVAIIGLSCRFPGASNPEAFWQLLRNGADAITEVPSERFDLRTFYDPNRAAPGKMNTRWGGFLKQVDQFDPQFFGISPREAARMDPQQRLLLEVTWEALEDAGQELERLAGTQTGVFIGISTTDYGHMQLSDPHLSDAYVGTGAAFSIAANRISYLFDFRGPSIAVDTACSSSLVAVHLACRSLQNGESTLAVAGGVNLILSPALTVNFTKAGFMAPDGRCKAFDARANGYVRSEGAGVVVLKPLSQALADGDPIYAMIRGSAVNQDGRSNGLMAPNPLAQEAVLREAYRRAGILPSQIQYIEAHGTGTLLGDPIEAKALGKVLATDRPHGRPCAIGSVKTNIGHLEAAAGIASLIKAALMLKHREIPPSLHFQEPNPHIPFAELPLRVQTTLSPWPEHSGLALAGVSSFGFGGTNAHLVLEEAPRTDCGLQIADCGINGQAPSPKPHSSFLLPLSARSPEALQAVARAYQDFLTTPESTVSLQDLCYTASMRRSHHDYRLAARGHSQEQLTESLQAFLRGEAHAGLSSGRRHPSQQPKLVFVFSGQGSQWPGMGQQLLDQEPVFRTTLEQCDVLLRQDASRSLVEELMADEQQSKLDETAIAQPILLAVQVALAALWKSWGIVPDAVVGHSVGEVAAAYVAGVLSLEDAMRIAFHRGQLMQRTAGQGKMAAVGLSLQEAERELVRYAEHLAIAAHNSPTSTVLSGDCVALEEVVQSLQQRKIACRWLPVNYAFHSPQMDPLQSELVQALRGLQLQAASLPIFSTVTGRASSGQDFDADYWSRQMRLPVLFAPAVEGLVEDGYTIFLEIAPHPVLSGAVSQCLRHRKQEGVILPSLRRGEEERAVLLGSFGALYTLGCPVDWSQLYPAGGRCIRLPSYPWQRERCWLETKVVATNFYRERVPLQQNGAERHPLLGRHVTLAHSPGTHVWEIELDRQFLSYLDDHRIQGAVMLPVSVYVEMVLAAATEVFGAGPHVLTEVEFQKALFLPESGTPTIQVILFPGQDGEASAHIYSRSPGAEQRHDSWTLHTSANIRHHPEDLVESAVRDEERQGYAVRADVLRRQ